MSSFMNDSTPEEQEPQNQRTIVFLRRAYGTHDTPMAPSTPLDDPYSAAAVAQATARVRERLLSARKLQSHRPNVRLLQPAEPSSGARYTTEGTKVRKNGLQPTRFAFTTLVALLTLVLVSSVLIFHQAHFGQQASLGQEQSEITPSSQQESSPSEQAHRLVTQFHEEAQTWGAAHLYRSPFDGKYYQLTAAYLDAGIGRELDQQLAEAKSDAAFKTVIEAANTALFHFRMFQAAVAENTPYNAVHQSDLELMKHYQLEQGTMVIVSTAEQALRVYRDGKLIKAALVTTGRQETPSLIGLWQIGNRKTNVIFKSSVPKGTSGWFADTPVHYALEYHSSGYYISDAWWRSTYGPGTQFPHQDPDSIKGATDLGNANDGSPGGIEMPQAGAQWLYEQTSVGTPVIIY